jgi:hypothetical protein
MTSHELAKKLLALPNKEIIIVLSAGKDAASKGFTRDMSVSEPWESGVGDIRISPIEYTNYGLAIEGQK